MLVRAVDKSVRLGRPGVQIPVATNITVIYTVIKKAEKGAYMRRVRSWQKHLNRMRKARFQIPVATDIGRDSSTA